MRNIEVDAADDHWLHLVGKGGKPARVILTPLARVAMDRYLQERGFPVSRARWEPTATARYLFDTMRATIEAAIAEEDPGAAVLAGDRFMTPSAPIIAPYHRHFGYSHQDGASTVTFTYSMRNRSTPLREEEDEHSFLLQLNVASVEHDKHHRLFRRAA